ncbi:HGGxSTG domain-containing protein [Aureimonas endophytica]|uniref:HGGxSTG domain-containing protein n=1 Tax=Aureimonas endophytica TaxID=2027858 RepID=UPI0016689F15|nr:HGGxSTG domain-containing protein [Aureimonas endophytica]
MEEILEREVRRRMAQEAARLEQKRANERMREAARQREREERSKLGKGSKKDRPLCGAKTRAGGSCAMRTEPGKKRCRLHGGLSTGPKTPEGIERIRQAQLRRWAWRRPAEPDLRAEEAPPADLRTLFAFEDFARRWALNATNVHSEASLANIAPGRPRSTSPSAR